MSGGHVAILVLLMAIVGAGIAAFWEPHPHSRPPASMFGVERH